MEIATDKTILTEFVNCCFNPKYYVLIVAHDKSIQDYYESLEYFISHTPLNKLIRQTDHQRLSIEIDLNNGSRLLIKKPYKYNRYVNKILFDYRLIMNEKLNESYMTQITNQERPYKTL